MSSYKLSIDNQPDFRVRKFLFTMAQIKLGFYQQKGFLLCEKLPEGLVDLQAEFVLIPQLLMEYILEGFDWDKLNAQDVYDFILDPNFRLPDANHELMAILSSLNDEKKQIHWNLTKLTEAVEVAADLVQIDQLHIIIHPNTFGALSTFKTIKNNEVHLYPRLDAPLERLFNSIWGALIRRIYSHIEWEEYHLYQLFMTYHTKIKDILGINGGPPLTPYQEIQQNPDLYLEAVTESKTLFTKLGFPAEETIQINNGKLMLSGYGEIDFLTSKEIKVFNALVQQAGNPISFDELGDTLWPGDVDKFSLQAISKLIERIRKKLKDNGLRKEIIFTKRRFGYIYIG